MVSKINDRAIAYAQSVVDGEILVGSGIYQIRNIINGKRYIGSAVNFSKRWMNHKKLLRAGKHHSIHLQRAWNINGEISFEFQILFLCQNRDLLLWEQHFIDKETPEYNICRIAGSTYGVKLSDDTKLKMSKAKAGRTLPAETRSKLSVSLMGHGFSKETRAKMSLSQSKRIHSSETKAKISSASVGENNGNAKLKQSDVDEIKKLYFVKKLRRSSISRQFGVNWSSVNRIIKGETWARKAR